MTMQDELVNRFQQSQDALVHAVADLSEGRAGEIWYGTWGAKQIVAHIAGWESAVGEALARIARGERPGAEGVNLSDVQGSNDQFAAAVAEKPFATVLDELGAAAGRLVTSIRSVPDDRLEEGKTARRMVETMIGHPEEHVAAIEEWKRPR